MNRRLLAHIIIIGLILFLGGAFSLSAESPIELTVFHSPLCGSCEVFDTQILPPLKRAYEGRLTVRIVDISTAEGLTELEQTEERLASYNNPLPVLVLENELLADQDILALGDMLEARLMALLGTPDERATASLTIPTPLPATDIDPDIAPDELEAPPIHVAYITKPYCDVCDRAAILLDIVRQEYPQMVIHSFDQVADAELLEVMGQHLGLPQEQRLVAPSLYIGDQTLIYQEVTSERLRHVLDYYTETGAPIFWSELDATAGAQSILGRFRSMGVLTVIGAGLIDGVNPCAFATILFFVSYLAISQRGRTQMLLVGLAFTLGVFLTYFGVGLGAIHLLTLADAIRSVGMVVYGLLALSCFVLAFFSLRDYRLARKGRLDEMSLNLPEAVRNRIHSRIRAGRKAFWGTAFVSGVIISFLELACTGQVYLPTISFVISVPEMRTSAIFYLLLYNVLFISPLLIVLGLATYGVNTRTFQHVFMRHASTAKIGMAVLFLLLGTLLVVQAVTL